MSEKRVCRGGEVNIQIEQADIQDIANAVVEMLKPLLQLPPHKEDEILSLDEVSRLMGKSKDQVYQWVNNSKHGLGTFPYMKAGRSLRFSRNKVMKWMESNGKTLEGR